jgi:hypothetical protein
MFVNLSFLNSIVAPHIPLCFAGNTSGYFNPTGPTPGWTCRMYGDLRTHWCSNGELKGGGGAKFEYPSRNCCVCGKEKPQPPSPPPAPSPARMDVCGGACQSGMVLQRGGARLWYMTCLCSPPRCGLVRLGLRCSQLLLDAITRRCRLSFALLL